MEWRIWVTWWIAFNILNDFVKGNVSNWSKEVFVIKKVASTVQWTYVISDLIREEIVGMFYDKELQNTKQKEIRKKK